MHNYITCLRLKYGHHILFATFFQPSNTLLDTVTVETPIQGNRQFHQLENNPTGVLLQYQDQPFVPAKAAASATDADVRKQASSDQP